MSKTISGIVTWLKNWFYSNDEVYDTGWQPFPFRTTENPIPILRNGSIQNIDFSGTCSTVMQQYNNQEPFYIRRIGKIVHMSGGLTSGISYNSEFPLKELCCGEHNNTTYNGDYYFTIGTLSKEFRPSQKITTVQLSSGTNKYVMQILTDGKVKMGRNGVTSYVNPPAGNYFQFEVTYSVD